MVRQDKMNRRRFIERASALAAGAMAYPLFSPTPVRADEVTDITFFVHADNHFGYFGEGNKHESQIAAMNVLPGKPYPADFQSATVDRPLAVWLPGDLTDHTGSNEWTRYVADYGLNGMDGKLNFPVLDSYGNHDILGGRKVVKNGVRQRQGALYYSKDWGRVHLAMAGIYPGSSNEAEGSLGWLKNDLTDKVGNSGKAVVIFFHYTFLPPLNSIVWWTDSEKAAFKVVIEGYNVVGIFHGHWHNTARYKWEGYDIYNVGATKDELSNSFAVVRMTDTLMEVADYAWVPGDLTGKDAQWGAWKHSKAITTGGGEVDTAVNEWARYD